MRLGAFVVLSALVVATAPVATATTLLPTEDGMSVPAAIMARLDRVRKEHMSRPTNPPGLANRPQTRPGQGNRPPNPPGQANRPETHPGKGRPNGGKPPPPPPVDTIPCFEGGTDCSDYLSPFLPCFVYTCDQNQRRCMSAPAEAGTPCEYDNDSSFGVCGEAPGKCRVIESDYGDFGVCDGTPIVGVPCNDYNVCTVDDKCQVVKTADGQEFGQCMGTFAPAASCSDYNDACTVNDRCQLVPTESGTVAVCLGDVIEGTSCNDFRECTTQDVCTKIDPIAPFDSGARCEGAFAPDAVCNDYNDCSGNDRCRFNEDYGFAFCQGDTLRGQQCNDYNDCTENDVCGEQTFSGGSMLIPACIGTTIVGKPCNDYNDCTANDACAVYEGEFNDYSRCQGDPTPGAPCNDFSPSTVNDMCVTLGPNVFCQGE